MAYTTINKPADYFNTVTYTGNGGTQSITGVGFQPDFVWGKNRNTTNWHDLEDVVRGATKRLSTNSTDAEATETNNFTSFDSDGFSVGSGPNVNGSGNGIVVWNWLAGGTASENTDGTITSSVSANTTSGFSIVTWSGSGTNDQTIGHGLGVAPSFIIHKNRTYGSNVATGHWIAKTKEKINSSGTSSVLYPNLTNAYSDNVHGTLITSGSTLLQVKGGSGSPSDFWVNASGSNYVAYCFAEKKGFSKFGSYTGNGNADGTFVYTGFKPAFVIFKKSSSANDWIMKDSVREPNNQMAFRLKPNSSNAEDSSSGGQMDFLSNGFKFRVNDDVSNASGGTYIYMAFAEQPLVTTGKIPATAR